MKIWHSSGFFSITAFFVFLLLVGFSANGSVITWTNLNGGNWSNTNNWRPNQLPGFGRCHHHRFRNQDDGLAMAQPCRQYSYRCRDCLGTWSLLRESVNLAMDAVPAGIDLPKV